MELENILSPSYRLNNFYSIVNKNSELIPFRENKHQAQVNASTYRKIRILKSRQIGFSTNEILKRFDRTIWNENWTACIQAHEDRAIQKLFRIVKTAYMNMHEDYRPELDRGGGSKYEMYFPKINSRIYCCLESRGGTINDLLLSEKAFMEPERAKATIESVPLDGYVTEETTPQGMNSYYDDWMSNDSVDDAIKYDQFFFPWYVVDENRVPVESAVNKTQEEKEFCKKAMRLYKVKIDDAQLMFRRLKIQNLRELYFQEQPEDEETCFLASGNPVLNVHIIKEMLMVAPNPIEEIGPIKIYKRRVSGRRYVIACDTAEGVGGDNSAAHVFDVESMEQVAVLHCDLKPSDFAHRLRQLAAMYIQNNTIWPLLVVERNNHGHAVLLCLSEMIFYPNLYSTDDGRLGWVTDRVTKPIMIAGLQDAIEGRHVIINDKKTLLECLTLINNKGKQQAADGKKDDLVISMSIAIQIIIFEKGKLSLYDNIDTKILI
jgi:hypothetical protein